MSEHRFNPERKSFLNSAERQAYWKPQEFITRFGLKAGERVLDLGCGTGFWTLPLAEKVGASGVVTALDVSQELLDDLAASHPPAQVHLLHSELPMIELPDGSVDFEWVAFVTHEVHPLVTLTREMRRVGKRAAVLDWRPDAVGGKGPPRDHRLTPQQTIDALLAGGFTTALQTWQDDDNYLIEATA